MMSITAALSGARYYDVGVRVRKIRFLAAGEPPESDELLTPRERQVVREIANGNNTQEVADRLGLSTKTIDSHQTNIMHKLDIHSKAGLVRYAFEHGLARVPGSE